MTNNLPPDLSTGDAHGVQRRPLHPTEQLFWQSWQLNPQSHALNTSLAFRIQGHLNKDALRLAVQDYTQHHPETSARITMHHNQAHFQRTPGSHIQLEHHQAHSESAHHDCIKHIQHTTFDLTTGPLARFALIELSTTTHTFIITFHHVISDYITGLHLAQYIADRYNSHATPTPQAPITTDQQHTDHTPPPSPHVHAHTRHLDATQKKSILAFAKAHHTTPFLLIASLWGYLLGKHLGNSPLKLSYPINRRPPEQNDRPGCFIEPCTLSIDTRTDNLTTLLTHSHAQHKANQTNTQQPSSHNQAQHLISISALTQTPFALHGLNTQTLALSMDELAPQSWLAIQIEQNITLQLHAQAAHHSHDETSHWLHTLEQLLQALMAQPTMSLNTWPITPHTQTTSQQASPPNAHQAHSMDAWQFHLQRLWQDVCHHNTPFNMDQNIKQWPVSSLQALQFMDQLNGQFQLQLPVTWLLQHQSISAQATSLAKLSTSGKVSTPLLTHFQQGTQGTLVLIHPGMGGIEAYETLLNHLPADIHVIGIDNPHRHGLQHAHASITAMAQHYITQVTTESQGPYWLMGWSLGGVIAHTMAQHMQAEKLDIKAVYLLDAHALSPSQLQWTHCFLHARWLSWLIPGLKGQQLQQQTSTYQQQLLDCARHELRLLKQHAYPSSNVPTYLFKAMQSPYWAFRSYTRQFDNGWYKHCASFHVFPMTCDHFNIIHTPHALKALAVAQQLR